MSAAPRPAGAADAVAGVVPRLAVEPATLDEAAEAMRALAADRLAVAFVGGGTDLGLGAPPARLDAVLHTRRLDRVREHAPSDQIVAVEGGMTLAALQDHLAPHGQRLALDPPLAARATVGGIVAANAFGPRRARFGAVRDLVIGMTVVRADGVVARGGGKVVKNVAGFDLPRLFCGSLGTLGLVAEVVFRLHPLPESSATVAVPGLGAPACRALARAVLDARLEPVAVVARRDGGHYRLGLRFEGFGPGVRDQSERALALAAAQGTPGERLGGADEAALWARQDAVRVAGDVRLRAAFQPAALATAAGALERVAGALAGGGLLLHPTLGIGIVSGTLQDPALAAVAIEAARGAVAAGHGSVVIAEAPAALRARVDPWGPPPAALELMRRLKRELDPDDRLAPGRLPGGI
ncbi:FAD-binding oxidoreductase [Anaeromyxobacter dehalogenans]|uniref:FAD linked oxidase-like protein n=1 Tax=Anaeromyxobacter dehalogenans (strain 2CP-C) TaxID=290397 RepID=Q2IDI2_ANADE|nr:FAD-binding oxidoreductase [Anaeromyxobacter dehalogenans]ABC82636.1 FAD linked oxidase-like protein [Anaeromyxobacter dehalogenans 2CP-C]